MPRPKRDREIEIKLRIESPAVARRLLEGAGFRLARRKVFEANSVYDTPSKELLKARKLLRIRTAGELHTLTFKSSPVVARHKSREELELTLADAPTADRILRALGYAPVFRYEKYRTEFSRPGEPGLAMLDETPAGDFLELEGAPGWIDRTARALGFRESDYLTLSYGSLYLEHCRQRGVTPSDMVFEKRPFRKRK